MMTEYIINPSFVDDEEKTAYSFVTSQKFGRANNAEDKRPYYASDLNTRNKREEVAEYDPYLHRNVPHPTTKLETFIHFMKSYIGIGIFSMPFAFAQSGYLVGIIATVIVGIICTTCLHMLVTANYELCKRRKVPSMTYPATAQAALEDGPRMFKSLAPYAPTFVNIFLVFGQTAGLSVYTLFIAKNIKDVFDQYMEPLNVTIWMLIILLPLILINYIRSLKFLAPFSTFANAITIGSFAIIFYYILRANVTFENRDPVGEIDNFAIYLGSVLFALQSIGIIIPLENEMKTPRAYISPLGVINVGMALLVIFYIAMGLLGFLAYGSDVEETITLSIGKTEILAQAVKIFLALAIFVSHPLHLYVAIDIAWTQYLNKKLENSNCKTLWEFGIRTGLVAVTVALPIAIPKLGLFTAFFGAFIDSALGLVCPAIINLCTFWYNLRGLKHFLNVIKNSAIILVGIIGLIIGTWISVRDIINSFK